MQTGCPGEQLVRNFFGEAHFFSMFSYFKRKNFGFLAKKFWVSVWLSKKLSESPGEHFEDKRFLEKIYVLLDRFWISIHFFSELWRKCLSTVDLTAFYVSSGRVWAETFFMEKLFFFFIFVYLVKNLFFLAKTSSAGSSYLHSWHPEERTEGKKTFFKINFSNHFRTLTEKHHGFVAEKKRSEGLSNLHFTCPGERFEEFRCGKTSSFLQCLRILSKNNQDIGQKNFSEVAQNEFYVSRGKYWGVFLGKSI